MGVFNFSTRNSPPVIINNNRESRHNGVNTNEQTVLISDSKPCMNGVNTNEQTVYTYPVLTNFQAGSVPVPVGDAHAVPVAVDALPAAVRAKALERLSFVRLVQSTIRERCTTAPDAVQFVAVNHAGKFPILRESGKEGKSALIYNNFRNWRNRIRGITDPDTALRALCDEYRRGEQLRKGSVKFWEYLFAFYLHRNRLTMRHSYTLACAKMRKIDRTTPVPTYAQVRYQLAKLDPSTVILAREGEESFRNRCVDFIRRDWSQILPGECLIGDSRIFDTRVKVWDDQKQRWIAVRPNIAGLLDARSWYLPAYWITTEPVNSLTLIDTLRLYFRVSGGTAPAHIYFDNGKDYCAKGFSTDFDAEGTPHSIFRELGIKLINSIAYNARAKTIERAFRDMMQQFDKLFPDYLGSRPGDRTLAADYYDTHAEELPSLQQFCEIFARWIADWHNTPKSGQIHKGKSPAEIWEKLDRSNALSDERLRMAFYKPEAVRSVGRGPAVSWNKKIFYSDSLKWGEKVLVKSDSMDPDHVLCFRPDGAFLCEARTRDRIRALALDDEAARKQISDSIARQRRQIRDAFTMLADLTGGRHLASPLELLLAPDGSEIVSGETIRKVKGASHSYTHHAIPGVIEPPELLSTPDEPRPDGEFDFRAEEDEEKLDEVAEFAKRRNEQKEEEPEISEVYDFITKKQKENSYDEYE